MLVIWLMNVFVQLRPEPEWNCAEQRARDRRAKEQICFGRASSAEELGGFGKRVRNAAEGEEKVFFFSRCCLTVVLCLQSLALDETLLLSAPATTGDATPARQLQGS